MDTLLQLKLMEKAIALQDEKQILKNLFGDIDPVYCEKEYEEIDRRYNSILRELAESVLINQ